MKRSRSMEEREWGNIEYKGPSVQEKASKKLMGWYIRQYTIKEVILTNVVKLRLLALMRIHSVVNISQVVRYRELVKRQRVKELKLIEVKVKEQEVKKILNKKMIREVVKYLVY